VTYKNHEVKLVERQEISQTRKDHRIFYEIAQQRTLLGKMSFRNVETCDLCAPCGPSAPIQAQVMRCAVSGVSPLTVFEKKTNEYFVFSKRLHGGSPWISRRKF
jgi:hypothetical protein